MEPELDNDTPPIEPDPSEAGPVEPDVPESEPTNLEPTENEPQPSTPEPETEPELGSISESERSGGGGSAPLEQSLAEDSPLAEPLDGDQLPNDDASTQANSSQASSEYLTNIPSESSTVISDINHSTSASGIGSSMMGGTSVGASSVGGHSPERTTDRSRASHSEADSKEDSDEKSETRARGQEGKPRVRERRVDTDSEVGLFRAGPGEN
ncbi:MAG: hypothetical protein LBG99_03060 [Propionibacteriaceae bacterium]|nr:hypothetical protein [Propionibacteriaceae bacterium]